MPTINVTIQVSVKVEDLKPETIGEIMCNAAAAMMESTGAEVATIIKVETFE